LIRVQIVSFSDITIAIYFPIT